MSEHRSSTGSQRTAVFVTGGPSVRQRRTEVSQTDELPGTEAVSLEPRRAETTGDSRAHLLEPLQALAAELGYTVAYEPIDPPGTGTGGPSRSRGWIIRTCESDGT